MTFLPGQSLSRDRCMYVLKNPFVEKQIAYLDVGIKKKGSYSWNVTKEMTNT